MHATASRRAWVALIGITLGRVAFGYQLQTVASLGTTLVAQLGIGYVALGSLIGAYLLPGAFAALPIGLLGRRWGEGRMQLAGVLLMIVGSAVPAVVQGVEGVAVGRVMAGLGAVGLSVMQGKVLADLFPRDRFAMAMGVAVSGFPIGVGLSQVLNPMLASYDLRATFLAGSLLAIGAALLVLPVGLGRATQPGGSRFGWPSRRECTLVLLAGLVWTTYGAGYFGFLSYVPALLQSRGVASSDVGWAISLATWLNIPAIIAGGLLVGRVGLLPVFMVGATCLFLAVAGIALSAHWLVWCLLFGTLASLHPGLIVAAGTLSARPQNQAVGMGLFYTIYYIGGTLVPVVCGAAADRFATPAAAVLTAALCSLLSLPLFALHQRLARV